MSRFARVSMDAARDARLNKTDLRVLIAISSFANAKTNQCWPSLATIRDIIGCKSNTTVHKAVKRLVEYGWLKKKRKNDKKGQYSNNLYEIVLENPLFTSEMSISPSESEMDKAAVTPVKGEMVATRPKGEKDHSPSGGETNRQFKHKNKTDGLPRLAFGRGPRPIQVWPLLTKELCRLGMSPLAAGECLQKVPEKTYNMLEMGIRNKEISCKEAVARILKERNNDGHNLEVYSVDNQPEHVSTAV